MQSTNETTANDYLHLEQSHIIDARIRGVYNLKPEDIVIPYGREHYPQLELFYGMRKDIPAMRFRVRPDVHVITKHEEFFVEEKLKYTFLEAIQLLR